MINIIFLDIDGVLNVISQGYDKYGSIYHQHFVDNLKYIIDNTVNTKIVISASGRVDGLQHYKDMWKFRNYSGEIIDTTPSLYINTVLYWNGIDKNKLIDENVPRGLEIDYYINNCGYEINNYVILDDDNDILYKQKDNLVLCSGNGNDEDCVDIGYGLTKNCAVKAVDILNRKKLM